jgi:hypothetical protein
MSQLAGNVAMVLRSALPLQRSVCFWASKTIDAHRQRSRDVHAEMALHAVGGTQFVLMLPTVCAAKLGAYESLQGLRNRVQLVTELLLEGGSADRQTA